MSERVYVVGRLHKQLSTNNIPLPLAFEDGVKGILFVYEGREQAEQEANGAPVFVMEPTPEDPDDANA